MKLNIATWALPKNATIGEKTVWCLMVAEARHCRELTAVSCDILARDIYDEACAKYGERAVNCKFEELSRRGYIDYGVSPRTGWLTNRGRQVLDHARQRELEIGRS